MFVMVWWRAAVGQLAAHSALVKGAEKVAIVDSVQYRMDYVKKWLPQVETIDFSKVQVSCCLSPTTVMACAALRLFMVPAFRAMPVHLRVHVCETVPACSMHSGSAGAQSNRCCLVLTLRMLRPGGGRAARLLRDHHSSRLWDRVRRRPLHQVLEAQARAHGRWGPVDQHLDDPSLHVSGPSGYLSVA